MTDNLSVSDIKRLTELYKRLLPVLEELCRLEEDIASSAALEQPERLEALVTEAQPLLLNFKGLDKKRDALLKELGISGSKPESILCMCRDDSGAELSELFSRLTETLKRFREAKENAERIMQLRINDINIRLDGVPMPSSVNDVRV